MKRFLDLFLAGIGLIVLAPAFAVLAFLIKQDSDGPVFYRGVRIGRFGKPFTIFKFRTMVANAELLGGSCTADDDPRITPVGRFLRKHKLDELPQLFNVLKGNMSFVGPRPEVQKYVAMFNEEEKQILTVKPGITDWATLWDSDEGAMLAGKPDAEQAYLDRIRPEKIRLQLKYVRERRFWTDMKIIFATVSLVLRRFFNAGALKTAGVKHSVSKEL